MASATCTLVAQEADGGGCDFFSRRARESEAKIAADDLGGIAPGRHRDAGARVTAGAAEIKVADW